MSASRLVSSERIREPQHSNLRSATFVKWITLSLLFWALAAMGTAQSKLKFNEPQQRVVGEDSVFSVRVPGPGILTVAVDCESELTIMVTYEDGSWLGSDGNPAPHKMTLLYNAILVTSDDYTYLVDVRLLDAREESGAPFTIAAAFLPFPAAGLE